MPNTNAPKDGDFASCLTDLASRKNDFSPALEERPERQTIQQVLVEGEEPTAEFLEEMRALNEAPEVSDDELERQALLAPGDDGDVRTPE